MAKYKVVWEVSKSAFVEADSEEEAIEKVMQEDVKSYEDEIMGSPQACVV